MKNLSAIVFLVIVISISGCITTQTQLENKTETTVGENVTAQPPGPTNVSAPPEPAEKTFSIIDERQATPGKNPALAVYGEKLWIIFERFTGSSEDLHGKSFDGKSFGSNIIIDDSDMDDIQPSAITYFGALYAFYTKTLPKSQTATIYYKIYNGGEWSSGKEVGALDFIFYYHNGSTVVYKNDLYLFWTKGKPSDYGFVSSRLLRKDYWLDGITMTGIAATTNDRDPKATLHKNEIFVLYENYVPNGERNDVYVKKYENGFWKAAFKLTSDSENSFKSSGSIISYNGKLYAVWVEQGDLYMRMSSNGFAWEETIRLTENDILEDEPSLAEYNGNLYLAFTRYSENAPFVYLAKLDA